MFPLEELESKFAGGLCFEKKYLKEIWSGSSFRG
jgi:hypothetical protein